MCFFSVGLVACVPLSFFPAPYNIKASLEGDSAAELQNTRSMNKGKWSEKEHRHFLYATEVYGNLWSLVTSFVETKTTAQVRSHAQKCYEASRRKMVRKIRRERQGIMPIFVAVKVVRINRNPTKLEKQMRALK
eukprot:TRINITY_DN1666_c0_g1_i6.p1 TRINITY_DN1666_c0_g1~~TRINITY_DN1666_c0_g1_i6.p1  ORF type:complete len:134 (+),score=5.11 TRINITY_DN1666_c0_g1_i6:332-733(+)